MDLRVLFSQLRPWMAVKMLLYTACARAFNPFGNTFYGISAEDQVIDSLLGHAGTGYYVDVGCNHPIRFSNTYSAYVRGWHGLTIDANRDFVELHKRVRPKDVSVCCAVSDAERDVVFTRFQDDSMSSISAEFVKEFEATKAVVARERVSTRTLTSIMKEHGTPPGFDLLCIDVEGHDLEALRGTDLLLYGPRLVVVEMRGFDFGQVQSHPIVSHLRQHGYDFVGFYGLNGFFLRKDTL